VEGTAGAVTSWADEARDCIDSDRLPASLVAGPTVGLRAAAAAARMSAAAALPLQEFGNTKTAISTLNEGNVSVLARNAVMLYMAAELAARCWRCGPATASLGSREEAAEEQHPCHGGGALARLAVSIFVAGSGMRRWLGG
jgi:hypothetical protein